MRWQEILATGLAASLSALILAIAGYVRAITGKLEYVKKTVENASETVDAVKEDVEVVRGIVNGNSKHKPNPFHLGKGDQRTGDDGRPAI